MFLSTGSLTHVPGTLPDPQPQAASTWMDAVLGKGGHSVLGH